MSLYRYIQALEKIPLMKKLRLVVIIIACLSLAGCGPKKLVMQQPAPKSAPQEQQIVKGAFSPNLLHKRRSDGVIVSKTSEEVVKTAEQRLLTSGYLPLAKHLLFNTAYTIKEKVIIYKELQKLCADAYTNEVLSFFERVLSENESYLTEFPLKNLETSLVSKSPDSSDFLKDHPEISNMIWSIDELFKQGNTLLQEAVRLNNPAAVHYLMKQGATPRFLSDPRGPVLALEWADKYGYTDVVKQLTKNINTLQETKTTLLDELLCQDPDAASLVRKYGGKTSVELV